MDELMVLDSIGRGLARFIGIYFTMGGLGTAINGTYFQKLVDDVIKIRGLQFNFAIIPLLIGSFLVAHYNVWSGIYMPVTIIGWTLLIGGSIRICLAPIWIGWAKRFGHKVSFRAVGILSTAIGLGFLYLGYIA